MDKGLHIEKRHCLIALALTFVHKPRVQAAAISRFAQTASTVAFNASANRVAESLGGKIDWRQLDESVKWAEQVDHHLLYQDDAEFPALLKEIPSAPRVLFVAGDPRSLSKPQLAIVGSRKASQYGLANAADIATAAAHAGLVVTSGLALGIDGAAHRATLSIDHPTNAVLGSGIDQMYPKRHGELRQKIQANGAIVTEFPLRTPPRPKQFPRRNRIISGLSIATVVVEAATKSGSLTTAKHALDQGREVFAVPGSIRSDAARGCHRLLYEGAAIVTDCDDLITAVEALYGLYRCYFDGDSTIVAKGLDPLLANSPGEVLNAAGPPRVDAKLHDPDHQRVMAYLDFSPISFDDLIDLSGLTSSELSILFALEMAGQVKTVAGDRYVAVTGGRIP